MGDETTLPGGPGAVAPQPGLRRFGEYDLLREVARGGQGAVYEARHRALGTRVALKLLHADDQRLVAKFTQEAQLLARLRHPNLLRVTDLGEVQGRPFLAMDFVDGEDLGSRVKRSGPLAPGEIVEVLGAVARTLQYCHDAGVVHRNLKPGNVVIEASSGRPVLVDFGLVKRDPKVAALPGDGGQPLSLSGEIKGTPAYMAPEQADASFGDEGPRADVYALGATLYFLLTGEAPYVGATPINILARLLSDKPPPDPAALAPDAPEALLDLCRRSLAKDAAQRPPSAASFAAALETAAAADDDGAPGPRRTGLAAAAAAAVAVALAAAALWATRGPPAPSPQPSAVEAPAPSVVEAPAPSAAHAPAPSAAQAPAPSVTQAPAPPIAPFAWRRLPDDPGPAARAGTAWALDARHGVVVLFGGEVARGEYRNDTWLLEGDAWRPVEVDGGQAPRARSGHALAYDAARGEVVLFGGSPGYREVLADTWVWDGARWALRQPEHSPPARFQAGFAYASHRREAILFGGSAFDGNHLGDVWRWNGNDWQQAEVEGPSPRPRRSMALADHPASKRLILFGGFDAKQNFVDTWAWDGTAWTLVHYPGRFAGDPPSARGFAACATDPVSGDVVLIGGHAKQVGDFADVWRWNGRRWRSEPAPLEAACLRLAAPAPDGSGLLVYGGDHCRETDAHPRLRPGSVSAELWAGAPR